MSRRPRHFLADFDSASAMRDALAASLAGRPFETMGGWRGLGRIARLANRLPRGWREGIYALGGWWEAIPPAALGGIDEARIAEWAVGSYPARQYPAVMLGSSNGALVFLAAALGIPWLPQTVLIPVRHMGGSSERPGAALELGSRLAGALLDRNPGLALHQMHDPVQDRLMTRYMTYFRVKARRLAPAARAFIERSLPPGGTIILSECERAWPVTRVGERHVFQMGGLGGLEPEQYLADTLGKGWDPPPADTTAPEAEWGFAPEILADIEQLARDRHYRILRLRYPEPESPSPLVADLYAWWYAERGATPERLLAPSFIYVDPWTTIASRSIPFWLVFPVDSAARSLERFLARTPSRRELLIAPFCHGLASVGWVVPERWLTIAERAGHRARLLGVDLRAQPVDLAVHFRWAEELHRLPRHAPPPRLTLEELQRWLARHGARYPVRWTDAMAA